MDLQIRPLPKTAADRAPVVERAPAQRQDWGFTAAAPNSELVGLVQGLSTLNPALQRYNDQAIQDGQRKAHEAGIAEANRIDMSKIAEQETLGTPLPSSVPPAFDTAFRSGFKSVLGDRAGANIKMDMLTQFNEQKDTEGFNLGGFLSDFRKKSMAGFADPEMAAKVGAHINQMEVSIREVAERARLERQVQAVDTAFAQVAQDKIHPAQSVEDMYLTYVNEILPEARRLNKSPKDAAEMLFSRVSQMSSQVGGAPQFFGVFNFPGADGKTTLSSYSPSLANRVEEASRAAQAQMDAHMQQDGQANRFKTIAALDSLRDSNPGSITVDLVSGYIGKHDLFPTMEAAHAYWQQANKLAQHRAGIEQAMQSWDDNTMWKLPPDVQQDVIKAKLGGAVDQLALLTSQGKSDEAAVLAGSIIKELSFRKPSVAVAQLEQFVGTLNSTTQSKDGPNANFNTLAALYRAASADPTLRDRYFKGDAADMMETYTRLVDGKSDPKSAYAAAYEAVSPAAKEASKKWTSRPENAKVVNDTAKSAVTSWLPTWLGGTPDPSNLVAVQADAEQAVKAYMQTHSGAVPTDMKAFIKSHVDSNWVRDETTGNAIKVPPAYANPGTQEAITAFSKKLLEQNLVSQRNDGDWKVEYRPEGTEGQVSVVLTNGEGSMTPLGRMRIADIVQAQTNSKLIDHTKHEDGTPNEADRIQELKRQLDSGRVDPMFLQENKDLIAKAKVLKYIPGSMATKLENMASQEALRRIKEVPEMTFGKPDYSTLNENPKKGSPVRIDNKLTAKVAGQYLATNPMGDNSLDARARNLTLSLLTMGEGVAVQAYPDPAKGAGNNIGTGYNLKANAATAFKDLKRAGVPESQIQAVMDGKVQMLPEQVSRLSQVVVDRYISLAKNAAEQTSPGLWTRMTPQQRAVMSDIAFQVKDVRKFQAAWSALAKGDQKTFAEEAQVRYTKPDGTVALDTRRNSLRAAMLSGTSQWTAAINKYASFPSNALDVAALATK